jgi:hypothetical protein
MGPLERIRGYEDTVAAVGLPWNEVARSLLDVLLQPQFGIKASLEEGLDELSDSSQDSSIENLSKDNVWSNSSAIVMSGPLPPLLCVAADYPVHARCSRQQRAHWGWYQHILGCRRQSLYVLHHVH